MTDRRLELDAFNALPLFATDKEIAIAIVGKMRAAEWLRAYFPTIAARPGFPKVDAFHGGRAVPRVKLFYEEYLGITAQYPHFAQDGEERLGEWGKHKKEKRVAAKANSDAWAEKKRVALDEFRAKKAAEAVSDERSRILTRKEAAASCKLTPAGFDVWVRKGIMPPATPGTRRWDQRAIDTALDQLSGLTNAGDRNEDSFEGWKQENAPRRRAGVNQMTGKGGYPIPTGPDDPLNQVYDELGFDPSTMGEKEMMELLKIAEDQWKASIPGTRLGKREIGALLKLAQFGVGVAVNAGDIKGCQSDTEARLEARGFIVLQNSERLPGQVESYVLTDAGFAASKLIGRV